VNFKDNICRTCWCWLLLQSRLFRRFVFRRKEKWQVCSNYYSNY